MAELLPRLQRALEGRYVVERELGRGGMAAVFLARDLRHDRPVALKVLHPELAASVGTERFEREIRLAARLQHPHILAVHDSGDVPAAPGEPPLLWFTMPYVQGESLRERLLRDRQLPLAEAIRIAREVADALEHAHSQGVIHRDIKPENILLSGSHALVADFGVARALGGGSGEAFPALTGTGLAVGTPAYMSPEQATGTQGVDARSDIYALGSVLYEMLAGEPPFYGPTPQAIITRILTEEPRPLRVVRSAVPPAVEQAVSRAIARTPADRFGSAADFARALELAPTQETAPALPAEPARRGLRRPLTTILALGFLLGVGVLFAWKGLGGGGGASDEGTRILAVLPFENEGDSGEAYFVNGMTDEVRGKLAGVPGFQVIARASSSQYRDRSKPLREIAEELGVRYLLTATVRWIKTNGQNRVQVRPELVEVVKSGATVSRWQQPFDAPLTDLFQVQADIAGQVASALRVAFAPESVPALRQAPTGNLVAYDEFLRGDQAYFGSSGSNSLRQAITHYQLAVANDSAFARAWARMAMVYSSMYVNTDPSLAVSRAAQQAAERALSLAPTLPEAHLAAGTYQTLIRGDFGRAIQDYTAGLSVAPNHPELLGAIGLAEQGMGRVDDALAHMRRGLELDPRSLLFTRRLVRLYTWIGDYPKAAELIQRARIQAPHDAAARLYDAWLRLARGDLAGAREVVQSIPQDAREADALAFFSFDWGASMLLSEAQQQRLMRVTPSAFDNNRSGWGIALAGAALGRGDRALARVFADSALIELRKQVIDNPNDASIHSNLGMALALLGRREEAAREGERAVAMRMGDGFQGPIMRHNLVNIYRIIGDDAKVIENLEALLRVPYYISEGWLQADPTLGELRRHPRFAALLALAKQLRPIR